MSNSVEAVSRRAIARLKFRDMQILLLVNRLGSMAKAAQHLSLTQPAISQSIAELEHALGYQLLERGPKGVMPTVYGAKLMERVAEIFDTLESGVRDLDFLANSGAGFIRVGADMSFISSGLMSEIIENISKRFPQITLEIVEMTTRTAKPDHKELRDRFVDVIIGRISHDSADNELEIETLFEEDLFVVAGKNSAWAKRDASFESLSAARWVLASPDNLARSLVQQAFKSQEMALPEPHITTYSMQLRMQLLQLDDYVTVMSETGFRHSVKNWQLHKIPIDLKQKLAVAMATLRQRSLPAVVHTFMDCARDIAQAKKE